MSLLNAKLEGIGERKGGSLPPLSPVSVPYIRSGRYGLIGAVSLVTVLMAGGVWSVFFNEESTVKKVASSIDTKAVKLASSEVPDVVKNVFASLSTQASEQVKETTQQWQTATTEDVSERPQSEAPASVQADSIEAVLPSSDSSKAFKQPSVNQNNDKAPDTERLTNTNISDSASSTKLTIESQSVTNAQLADRSVKQGKTFWQKGDVNNAIASFELALKYAPDRVAVRQQLASIHYGRGDVWKAEQILLAGIRPTEFQGELRWTLAKLWGQENHPEKALSFLMPDSPLASASYLLLRAQLAQQLGNFSLALSSYQILTERFSHLDSAWLGLAIESERAGGFSQAKMAYQRALQGTKLSRDSLEFAQQRLTLLEAA